MKEFFKKRVYGAGLLGLYILTTPYRSIIKKLRKTHILKKYDPLNQFRKKHAGERCFILLTGPSLTLADVKRVQKDITIGVNSLCRWFKELNWSTSYFVISDLAIYDNFYGLASDAMDKKNIFVSAHINKTRRTEPGCSLFPIDIRNRLVSMNSFKKISRDITVCSYDGESVVIHAIQLAAFMGVREIYLLGADCNYEEEKPHAIDNNIPVYNKKLGLLMIEDYKFIKKYTDKWGIKVYNATRGGKLEVFERVDLDSLFHNSR